MRELKTSFFSASCIIAIPGTRRGFRYEVEEREWEEERGRERWEGGVERREVLVAAFSKMCVPHKHLLQQQQQNLLKQQQQ